VEVVAAKGPPKNQSHRRLPLADTLFEPIGYPPYPPKSTLHEF
jgi:hypothetical protein